MKERPMLFSGPMVRAILEGRKTQTRRVIDFKRVAEETGCRMVQCPYGQTGDRLWVKETWKPHCDCDEEGVVTPEHPLGTCVKYRADGAMIKPDRWNEEQGSWCEANENTTRWFPSIHMPRWASRITLELTGVRVERVQDISEEDAKAEGCEASAPARLAMIEPLKNAYRILWDSISAARGYGWDKNPWVWVLEFKRVSPDEIYDNH